MLVEFDKEKALEMEQTIKKVQLQKETLSKEIRFRNTVLWVSMFVPVALIVIFLCNVHGVSAVVAAGGVVVSALVGALFSWLMISAFGDKDTLEIFHSSLASLSDRWSFGLQVLEKSRDAEIVNVCAWKNPRSTIEDWVVSIVTEECNGLNVHDVGTVYFSYVPGLREPLLDLHTGTLKLPQGCSNTLFTQNEVSYDFLLTKSMQPYGLETCAICGYCKGRPAPT